MRITCKSVRQWITRTYVQCFFISLSEAAAIATTKLTRCKRCDWSVYFSEDWSIGDLYIANAFDITTTGNERQCALDPLPFYDRICGDEIDLIISRGYGYVTPWYGSYAYVVGRDYHTDVLIKRSDLRRWIARAKSWDYLYQYQKARRIPK